MNIITIPDLHGKNNWKHFNIEDYDKVVFLGDYVDSKEEVSDKKEIENLEEIIEFKLKHPDKVVLLLGNHDIHYLYYPLYRASSFNERIQNVLTALFKSHKDLFAYAFQMGNHLWTHAGVSNAWFRSHISVFEKLTKKDTRSEIASILNEMELHYLDALASSSPTRGGSAPYGGILWADKSETVKDYLPLMHQYVGHSRVPAIERIGDEMSSIYYLDCLNSQERFFIQTIEGADLVLK